MSPQEIENKVRQVMAGLFALDPTQVGTDSSMETIERWDSLQHVNLVMALEQDFNVRFAMDDVTAMTSFGAICATLARYLGRCPSES